jgi:phosphopantetheinyl transferase
MHPRSDISLEHCATTIKPLLQSSLQLSARSHAHGMDTPHATPRVFSIAISAAGFPVDADCACLGDEERTALAAMASRKRRGQYAAGRLLLRHALHETFGGDPALWRIPVAGNGQPRPVLDGREPSVSVSHSGALALCGVAAAGALGVDVECCRPRPSGWGPLADVALHSLERDRLAGLPEQDRWRGFYVAWTLKEALAKALGLGLALAFDEVAFSHDARVIAAPDRYRLVHSAWRFATLDLGAHAVGAVAWKP